jgi:hypothetical protein
MGAVSIFGNLLEIAEAHALHPIGGITYPQLENILGYDHR